MDGIKITGKVLAELWDRNGDLYLRRSGNFLTIIGERYIADRLSDRDESDGDVKAMAIGEGSGMNRSAAALNNEVARVSGANFTLDQGTGTDANDVIMVGTFGTSVPASDKTITEGGVWTHVTAPNGTLMNYFEFNPGIWKATTMTLVITVTWTIGAG